MNHQKTGPVLAESVALTYFTDFQAITVEVIAERIIPANGSDAGATEAGVVYYIDRSITGFSSNLQRIYRLGLRELERYCDQRYSTQFHELDAERQDEIIRHLLGPEILEPTSPPDGGTFPDLVNDQTREDGHKHFGYSTATINEDLLHRLFAVIREHTVEDLRRKPQHRGVEARGVSGSPVGLHRGADETWLRRLNHRHQDPLRPASGTGQSTRQQAVLLE